MRPDFWFGIAIVLCGLGIVGWAIAHPKHSSVVIKSGPGEIYAIDGIPIKDREQKR